MDCSWVPLCHVWQPSPAQAWGTASFLLMEVVSSVLGWYTETSYRAHPLTFCFISLNLGWQWQISSMIYMQWRWCTWVSKADSTFWVILQVSGDAAQTGNDGPSKIGTHLSAQRQKLCPSSTNSQMATWKEMLQSSIFCEREGNSRRNLDSTVLLWLGTVAIFCLKN